MTPTEAGEATQLLHAIQEGDATPKEWLIDLVFNQLRDVAAKLLVHEDPSQSLQPTVLVHEAYLRLDRGGVLARAPNRHYFLAAAAQAMRQALVDQARRRRACKRSNGWKRVPLDAVLGYFRQEHLDVAALHEALGELAVLDERQSRVVVLRFFGGFTVAEVTEQLSVSVSTVESDSRRARAWLHRLSVAQAVQYAHEQGVIQSRPEAEQRAGRRRRDAQNPRLRPGQTPRHSCPASADHL